MKWRRTADTSADFPSLPSLLSWASWLRASRRNYGRWRQRRCHQESNLSEANPDEAPRRVNRRTDMTTIAMHPSEDRTREYYVPPNLAAWMPKEHLARLAWRLVRTVDTGEIGPVVSLPEGKVLGPQMMLSLVVYSYAVGVLSSSNVERSLIHDENARHLSGGNDPDCNSVCAFRQSNHEIIKRCLEMVYLVAWKIR